MRPSVSIVIPVRNEERYIEDCLKSIYGQEFPSGGIEVLIIDDDSHDRTIEIAESFPVTVLKNGRLDYDIGKAIGISHAHGDFIVFMDADNRLTDPKWLSSACDILESDPRVVAVQSWKFDYRRDHNVATRYADLFGNMDPVVHYLGAQDHLQWPDLKWNLAGDVAEDDPQHLLVRFNQRAFPTIGSQGCMTRRRYVPPDMSVFQHVEFFMSLAESEPDALFCFSKTKIEHLAARSVADLRRKLTRNMDHYLHDRRAGHTRRYAISVWKIARVIVITQSLVIPAWDAWRGNQKIKDPAWFLHSYLSFVTPWMYAWRVVKHHLLDRLIAFSRRASSAPTASLE